MLILIRHWLESNAVLTLTWEFVPNRVCFVFQPDAVLIKSRVWLVLILELVPGLVTLCCKKPINQPSQKAVVQASFVSRGYPGRSLAFSWTKLSRYLPVFVAILQDRVTSAGLLTSLSDKNPG